MSGEHTHPEHDQRSDVDAHSLRMDALARRLSDLELRVAGLENSAPPPPPPPPPSDGKLWGLYVQQGQIDNDNVWPLGNVFKGHPANNIVEFLNACQAHGKKAILEIVGGQASKNADGTFNYSKWKAGLDAAANLNLEPYVADGTLIAHYALDEPMNRRWADDGIAYDTLRDMTALSKQYWPTLPVYYRVAGSKLENRHPGKDFSFIDGAWCQFTWRRANNHGLTPDEWIAQEIAAASAVDMDPAKTIWALAVLHGGADNNREGAIGNVMTEADITGIGQKMLNAPGLGVCSFRYQRNTEGDWIRYGLRDPFTEMLNRASMK